ncbi:MAG TPA: clostripain-related cysteine peptidase, partial [Nitrososphaera sp.]|nr:clostripain-related cysteine peptidase [Nitrososphaera sp.]
VFLFDENADEHSLKLATLGNILRTFSADVKLGGGSFDLLGFHSCSVSSLEVAYELQDTARYMLASQGTAFVGSWPYRQMLKRVFKGLSPGTELNTKTLKEMLIDLFFFCMHNSTDFLLAGYPFDLSLCDLSKISTIREPLEKLAKALVTGLEDKTEGRHCADLIVLAHWRAQSFYQEMYTDLYDFCFCLREKIKEFAGVPMEDDKGDKGVWQKNEIPQNISPILQNIFDACNRVTSVLDKEKQTKDTRGGEEKLIICSEFAGPESQYSHGLSVYFPWSTPNPDRRILEEYSDYKLSGEEFETTWLDFLKVYWDKTMRQPSRVEQNKARLDPVRELYEDKISLVYTQEGPRN